MANEYRVTTFAAEVLHNGEAKARVTTVAVEVMRSIATASAPSRRRISMGS